MVGFWALQALNQPNHSAFKQQGCILPKHANASGVHQRQANAVSEQGCIFTQSVFCIQTHRLQGWLAAAQRIVQAVIELIVQVSAQTTRPHALHQMQPKLKAGLNLGSLWFAWMAVTLWPTTLLL
jgi:hypothetical protein